MRLSPRSLPASILALLLTLTACTSQAEQDVPLPAPDPCVFEGEPEAIPEECIEPGPPEDGPSPPGDSAQIAPVQNPPVENELARGGNDSDPALTEMSFEVTVPAGGRLRSTVACNGAGTVRLTTSPESGAEQEFDCAYGNDAVELTVEDATPLERSQTYSVSFTADSPARWIVVLSYAEGEPDADRIGD